jgi:hypothetical protein
MPTYGKCPSCQNLVSRLDISTVEAQAGPSTKVYNAATFLCPNCQTVLGAGIDPVGLASDLGTRVVDAVYEAAKRLAKRLDSVDSALAKLSKN